MRLLLFFIAIPLVELWLLFEVAGLVGGFETVLLVIATAFTGVMLLRHQGISTLARAREKWRSGELPAQELIEALMLAFSGALLLMPGFISDAIGLLIMLAPVRRLMAARLAAKGIESHLQGFADGSGVKFSFKREWGVGHMGRRSGLRGDRRRGLHGGPRRFGVRTFEGTVAESSFAANDAPSSAPSDTDVDEVADATPRETSVLETANVVTFDIAGNKRPSSDSQPEETIVDMAPVETAETAGEVDPKTVPPQQQSNDQSDGHPKPPDGASR